jgi:hypothetical protein
LLVSFFLLVLAFASIPAINGLPAVDAALLLIVTSCSFRHPTYVGVFTVAIFCWHPCCLKFSDDEKILLKRTPCRVTTDDQHVKQNLRIFLKYLTAM